MPTRGNSSCHGKGQGGGVGKGGEERIKPIELSADDTDDLVSLIEEALGGEAKSMSWMSSLEGITPQELKRRRLERMMHDPQGEPGEARIVHESDELGDKQSVKSAKGYERLGPMRLVAWPRRRRKLVELALRVEDERSEAETPWINELPEVARNRCLSFVVSRW